MACTWDSVTLGRSGITARPIGLGASFGLTARDVQRAFERGINFFYWGSVRTPTFGEGISALAGRHRADMVVVIQTYAREASKVRASLQSGLERMPLVAYADFLLLGAWDRPPPPPIMDAALECVRAGLARKLMISCHHRPTFEAYIAEPAVDAIMVRYNAAHDTAERDVFPKLGTTPPGVIAYTATRWGDLVNPGLTPAGDPTPRGSDCYRFALSCGSVDLCLAGPRNGDELDEAMAALDRGPMSADELAWMRRVGKAIYPLGKERMAAMAREFSGRPFPYD